MESVPRRLTFGAHAGEYERARPEWPKEAARWFVPENARLVVELGAGTGKLTRALAALGVRVVAVEPDPRMLAVLRERGLDGVEGSAEAVPVPDGEADAVVAGSAMHWFDLERALPEFHRVLRPGGRLGFGWNHRDSSHPTIGRVSEAVYSVRPPERRRWGRDWSAAVTAAGLFRDVEHRRFEHVHEVPRSQLDDLLVSYAALGTLPEADRLPLFARVAEIVDADTSLRAGDRLRLPYVVDAYRAIRAD